MKNNLVVVLLVILIGISSGVGLLLGIGNMVSVAVFPLYERVTEQVIGQKTIERKINGLTEKLAGMEAKLAGMEGKLANLRQPPSPNPVPDQAPPSEDLNKVYDIPAGNSIIVGKKNAPVTIVKFTDLQCPFCSRFYPPVKEALKAYPDQVRLIIKNFPLPFHPNARPAAKMALAANAQGKYIEMVELLLENGADVSEVKVKEYAKKLGLNYDRLMADLKNNDAQYEQQIKADLDLVGQVDVRGTPTFFINGKKTTARDFNGFKAEIDKILQK
ncbi:MAG: thioredoxin domain-containing protein [Candidatus Omnitrophica bacterium]|nr:thioredoxin domain-containing protein [Candidatus Omnitrophota bacterium]